VEDNAVGYVQYSGSNQCVQRFVYENESNSKKVEAFSQTSHTKVEVRLQEHTLDSAETPLTTGTHAIIMIGVRFDKKKRSWFSFRTGGDPCSWLKSHLTI